AGTSAPTRARSWVRRLTRFPSSRRRSRSDDAPLSDQGRGHGADHRRDRRVGGLRDNASEESGGAVAAGGAERGQRLHNDHARWDVDGGTIGSSEQRRADDIDLCLLNLRSSRITSRLSAPAAACSRPANREGAWWKASSGSAELALD